MVRSFIIYVVIIWSSLFLCLKRRDYQDKDLETDFAWFEVVREPDSTCVYVSLFVQTNRSSDTWLDGIAHMFRIIVYILEFR